MISPIPGAIATKPGSGDATHSRASYPKSLPWTASRCPSGSGRISHHQQALARHAAHASTAIPTATCANTGSQIPGVYFTGDGARKDKDGYFWIMGRVDDVLNVSGHRLSTMEVESALVAHDAVAEAARGGPPGRSSRARRSRAFVTLEKGRQAHPGTERRTEASGWRRKSAALAKPDDIRFTDMLPKTRSGKIMRRLLRELATSGDVKGDVTTLEDFGVIAKLKEQRRSLSDRMAPQLKRDAAVGVEQRHRSLAHQRRDYYESRVAAAWDSPGRKPWGTRWDARAPISQRECIDYFFA